MSVLNWVTIGLSLIAMAISALTIRINRKTRALIEASKAKRLSPSRRLDAIAAAMDEDELSRPTRGGRLQGLGGPSEAPGVFQRASGRGTPVRPGETPSQAMGRLLGGTDV